MSEEGTWNQIADKVKRIDRTWSDTNLAGSYFPKAFDRLKCRNCQSISFEVLKTGAYETSARCIVCGMYFMVHCG